MAENESASATFEMKPEVDISENKAVFRDGAKIAGEYVLDDPFKPHFHRLYTPSGHNVVLVSPGDHRHHKGLMYALRCRDLNFWEEDPGSGHCGVQEVLETKGVGRGIRQQLLWREENGGLRTYQETREIWFQRIGDHAFEWSWSSIREALRDHRLVKSEWSLETPDGRFINYHGLGVRLPWMWAFKNTRFNGIEVDGVGSDPMDACGTNGPRLGWWGRIDGYWTPPVATVTLGQEQEFTWFCLKGDFPYLAVGPSNLEERDIVAGSICEERYTIRVEDRIRSHGAS